MLEISTFLEGLFPSVSNCIQVYPEWIFVNCINKLFSAMPETIEIPTKKRIVSDPLSMAEGMGLEPITKPE